MMQFDKIISWFYENARTKMKMQGQKEKYKDDIKTYSLDRLEQVERSKIGSNFLYFTNFRFRLFFQPTAAKRRPNK